MQALPIARLSEFANSTARIAVDGAGFFVVWEDGEDPENPTLEQAKAIARTKLYAIAANKISALTADYSLTEQIGWPDKRREARDYQETQDPGLCPNLLAIAALGGRTLQSLVNTVLAKAAELQSQVNLIDAERGRLCDLVAASETVSEVQEIIWE